MGAGEELTKKTQLACMFWRHQDHLPLADSGCRAGTEPGKPSSVLQAHDVSGGTTALSGDR